jgi:transposase
LSFVLTGGNVHDRKMAEVLLRPLRPAKQLLADKGYDCDDLRLWLQRRGTNPIIPGRSNRLNPMHYNKKRYRLRNVIERMFCRIKDFRRLATRYDKSARHFLSALCLVAAFAFWII